MLLPRTTSEVRTLYRWDKSRLQYRDAQGRFVKAADVRKALTDVVNANKRAIRSLARQLNAGTIGVQQWQQGMETAVRDLHLGATAAGRGGFGQMTQRDYGMAGLRLRRHYEFIDNFARDVEARRITPGRTLWRSELYAKAARGVYENSRREGAIAAGFTEGRRILNKNGEHCKDCVAEAAKGWQPIRDMKRLGDSVCKAACTCGQSFRRPAVT